GRQDGLTEIYGKKRLGSIPLKSEEFMTLENVIAEKPDAVIAGWGYSLADNLTPSNLAEKYDIAAYTLSLSCGQNSDGDANPVMEPWEVMFTDLQNIGKITGQTDEAKSVSSEAKQR